MPNTLYMRTWGLEWLLRLGVIESIDLNFSGAILTDALNRFGELYQTTDDQSKIAANRKGIIEN